MEVSALNNKRLALEKWILKAMAQKAVSYLPAAHHINYLVHKYITKGKELPEDFFADRISHFTNHYRFIKQFHPEPSPALNVLELGTGWHPIVPVAFFLSGHTDIITIDIRPQLYPEMVAQTLQWFVRYGDEGKLQKFVPDLLPKKVETLRNLLPKVATQKPSEILQQLNIQTWNADARNLPLPTVSRDLIISNNVLQDIPAFILEGIFKEFQRVAKPTALQSHFIDLSDQFSHADTSITNFNFLQFSETTWKLLTNSLQAQNRERIPFYRNLYLNTGLKIVAEENNHGNLTDVKKVKLHPKFQAIPLEDVAVLHTHMVGNYEN